MNYTEIQTVVEKYFKEQLSKGVTINEIVQNLKSGPLPWELRKFDCPISSVRRAGQHVSTQYMLLQDGERSATVDLADL